MRLLVFFLLASPVFAQAPTDMGPVYTIVEVAPEPIGGVEELEARVAYPPEADGLRGTVLARLVISPEGRVTEATCDAAPSRPICAAALDAIRATWFVPGRARGDAVSVRFTLPVEVRPPTERVARATDARRAVAPEVVGGQAALLRRVMYPEMARRAGVEGRIFVQFRIGPGGEASGATCVGSPNELLCEAAVRAVRESRFIAPPTPAASYTIPIHFTLR